MSEQNDRVLIETAMSIIATQIDALNDKDIDMFKMCFTDEIQSRFNEDLWNAALKQHERIPLSLDMIDPDASEVQTSANIKLVLKNGRTLCNLVKKEFDWLVADIYWRVSKESDGNSPESTSAEEVLTEETNAESATTEETNAESTTTDETNAEPTTTDEANGKTSVSEDSTPEDPPSE